MILPKVFYYKTKLGQEEYYEIHYASLILPVCFTLKKDGDNYKFLYYLSYVKYNIQIE